MFRIRGSIEKLVSFISDCVKSTIVISIRTGHVEYRWCLPHDEYANAHMVKYKGGLRPDLLSFVGEQKKEEETAASFANVYERIRRRQGSNNQHNFSRNFSLLSFVFIERYPFPFAFILKISIIDIRVHFINEVRI